jgi:hypothetical protein
MRKLVSDSIRAMTPHATATACTSHSKMVQIMLFPHIFPPPVDSSVVRLSRNPPPQAQIPRHSPKSASCAATASPRLQSTDGLSTRKAAAICLLPLPSHPQIPHMRKYSRKDCLRQPNRSNSKTTDHASNEHQDYPLFPSLL